MSASIRGAARKRIGEMDIISSAATSSLTVIVPSSAAIAEPTHAARLIPHANGPISLSRVSITAAPRYISWLKRLSSSPTCSARIIPMKSETTVMTGSVRIPVT